MQLIAVDIGNSSTKIAVEHTAHNDRWSLETIIRSAPCESDFLSLDIDEHPAFWAVSSVNQTRQQQLATWVAQHRPQDCFHPIQPNEVDLESDVESRQQLGRDRLIAAWQATQLNDGGPLMVIDAGTAVTIDRIDEGNVFRGGVIFPGAQAALRNLAAQSEALPDYSEPGSPDLQDIEWGFVGKSTRTAILLGVYQSQICTINSAVNAWSDPFQSVTPAVYATGGGIEELKKWLPESWQYEPDLVLRGALGIGRRLQLRR